MKINNFIKETSLKWNNCGNTPLCLDIVVLQGRYSEDERSNAELSSTAPLSGVPD